MPIPCGVSLELLDALTEVKNQCDEYGDTVYLYLRGESNIIRDDYNSIKTPLTVTPYAFNAFPIIPSPNQYQMEKAGIFEKVETIIYLANLDFMNNNISIDNVEALRSTIVFQGETYLIKDKTTNSSFANNYLYITLGLDKK